MSKAKVLYAIPCAFTDDDIDDLDEDNIFFLTFQTKDEDEALRLASCVCGPSKARKALVIISENGSIFHL
jgi:hypothetical protein